MLLHAGSVFCYYKIFKQSSSEKLEGIELFICYKIVYNKNEKEFLKPIEKARSYMCDIKKYNKIYKDIVQLQPDDTLQLVLEAATEEEKRFYEMVENFLLQQRQAKVIERKKF